MIKIEDLSLPDRLVDINLVSTAKAIAIIGPNGSGKSSLLHCIQGTIATSAITLSDRPYLLPQQPTLLSRSAAENLAYIGDIDPVATLATAGLEAKADTPAKQLSGGQAQLLALLMLLSQSPRLLLLDEPTSALDIKRTKLVETMLRRHLSAGNQIIFTTHAFNQATRLADEIWVMMEGRLVRQSRTETAFEPHNDPMVSEYLQGLIQ
ncbi:MAG: ATP-binding cassette domain-containing protein [Gammaproteobacteria bacterium]|nr:ATP-binding cassette domain-containing protein [Gammaproteobacteria bacterium]